jgi:hypothetical protein
LHFLAAHQDTAMVSATTPAPAVTAAAAIKSQNTFSNVFTERPTLTFERR